MTATTHSVYEVDGYRVEVLTAFDMTLGSPTSNPQTVGRGYRILVQDPTPFFAPTDVDERDPYYSTLSSITYSTGDTNPNTYVTDNIETVLSNINLLVSETMSRT